jgi:hypothetical protein
MDLENYIVTLGGNWHRFLTYALGGRRNTRLLFACGTLYIFLHAK